MKTRRSITAMIAGTTLLALAGCGSSGGDSGDKTIKVVYLNENATVGPLDAVMKKAKGEYEKANPGFEVDLQPMKVELRRLLHQARADEPVRLHRARRHVTRTASR